MPLIAVVIIRFVQVMGLIALLIGFQQISPLVSLIRESFAEGDWPVAKLCGRLAMVTGPTLIACIFVGLLQWLLTRAARTQRALQASGDQPWLTNPMWAEKHIRLSNRPAIIAFVVFLTVFLLVVFPLAIATEKTPFLIAVSVVGLFVLILFRIQWLNRKWNRSELRISTLPGIVGGPFTGVAILKQTFSPGTVFEASLRCIRTETTRHNNRSETKQVVLWSSLIHIAKTLGGSQPNTTAIPVSFAIPYDCEPTDMIAGSGSVRWNLSINEKDKVGFGGAVFEVPVFKTADSRPNFAFDSELIEEYLEEVDPEVVLRRYNMVRTRLEKENERFEFNEFQASILFALLAMSAILVAIIYAISLWVTSWQSFLVVALMPGCLLAMMVYGVIHVLFWKCIIETGTASLEVQAGEPSQVLPAVIAQSGVAGFRKSISVPRDSSTVLKCVLDSRSENKEQWSVQISSPNASQLKLIPMLKSQQEALSVQLWLAGAT